MIPATDIIRLGLIAGEGNLPVHAARYARAQGIKTIPFLVSGANARELRAVCAHAGHRIVPGLLRQTFALLQREGITHLVFAGKVNKWILLKDPRIDSLALEALRHLRALNDDALMLWVIAQLEGLGIRILPQADFLSDCFLPEGLLSETVPSEIDWRDARYGFQMAKEMGRLDIGQTVVVKNGMMLAVEAIEGTDHCLRRAGQWAHGQGGVVVKVAKPDQDQRFDIPTVGLRTLETMRRAKLHMLAVEAGKTLFLEAEAMTRYANRHGLIIASVDAARLDAVEPAPSAAVSS